MNIKRAKEEIKDAIEAYLYKDAFGQYAIPQIRQRPVLLIGPPGIGKTQIMEQVAKECKVALVAYTITHHTRQSAVGLPYISKKLYGGKEYSATEYTMSEIVASIYDKIEATGLKEGILFIDEINCVSETLAPAMLQFLQCKTFGNHRIPEGWMIVAAWNPPEYNKSVRDFDVVTLDRIKKIVVEPDYEVWREYALQEGIHPAVCSYLQSKKQYLCCIETTVDGKLFATPRGWEDLSRLIQVYEEMGKKADRETIVQYLQHPKIAKDFANYLSLYQKYQEEQQVEDILTGVIRESFCDKMARAPFDERLGVISILLARLGRHFRDVLEQEDVMDRVMKILKRYRPGEGETEAASGQETETVLAQADGPDPHEPDPAGRLRQLIWETEQDWEGLEKQELLTRREDVLYRKVQRQLEGYLQALEEAERGSALDPGSEVDGGAGLAAGWAFLRERFAADSDRFEEDFGTASQMLEHGFDFMEAAFGDSQEMVIFITELNTSPYAVGFLQEYACERYHAYNERLMFDDREQELLGRI